MKYARATIILLLALAFPAPPAQAAGRRPVDRLFIPEPAASAPVETLAGSDVPLDRHGAGGTLAQYLDGFDVKAGKFEYTLQLLAEEESFRI